MKPRGRKPSHPIAWREEPRDENGALKAFPKRAEFIAHLRANNRPTTKDLRTLRALKKAKPLLAEPQGE